MKKSVSAREFNPDKFSRLIATFELPRLTLDEDSEDFALRLEIFQRADGFYFGRLFHLGFLQTIPSFARYPNPDSIRSKGHNPRPLVVCDHEILRIEDAVSLEGILEKNVDTLIKKVSERLNKSLGLISFKPRKTSKK